MMGGQLQAYQDLLERDHERMNELEDELISLRRMVERIGKEKRTCMVESGNRVLFWMLGVLLLDSVFLIIFVLDKVR